MPISSPLPPRAPRRASSRMTPVIFIGSCRRFGTRSRALLIRAACGESKLLHGIEHPAVDGFEPIPHVGQGPADDDAHGVVQVGPAHLLMDVRRSYLAHPV